MLASIKILVDEDIEAYLNGTLVFINGGLMLNSNNVVFYNAKKESYYNVYYM